MRASFSVTATMIGLLGSLSPAGAADLKDCKGIKDPALRMNCLEENIAILNTGLAGTVMVGKEFLLSTRGRCLSYFDENKPAITMTCDHPDLQKWKFQ
jgi:hypothetical protein